MSYDPVEALSQAVSSGIDLFAIGLGDDMYNMSTSMNSTDNGYEGKLLVDIATFTYNPFNDPTVLTALKESMMLYILFLLAFILIGGSYVQFSRLRPTREFLGMNLKNGPTLGGFLISVFGLIILAPLIPFFMWVVLMFNYVICQMIMSSILPSIIISPDNVTLYVAMAFIYLLMSVAFIWRALVIGMCLGYCLVIFILIVIKPTRDIGVTLSIYFIVMVLMQPVILAATCVGVGIIQFLNVFEMFGYFVLGLFLFAISLLFVLGPALILWLVRRGKQTLKLVV